MTDATAKFPGTTGTSQLAQSDVGGEIVGIGEAEWTLATQILSGTAAPLSIVVNETVSARVPTTGWLILDSEIFHFNALNTGTKTFTADARSQQDTAAGQHDVGTWVGFTVTKRWYNQIVADIISMQTQMLSGIHNPNLVLNSDFSRRTVFGLAMPEVFADTSGLVVISGSGGVASNLYTTTAINTEIGWCNQSFVWRDGRASFTWKAVSTTDRESLFWRIDSANFIELRQSGGNLTLRKTIAGVDTQIATVANALTVNRYYWGELDKQGTTCNVRFYDTLGTVPGVTKASSTEVTAARLTGTIADAAVQVGAHISAFTATNGGIFGGIATGNGGVYVETWLPESYSLAFAGTLGGLAIGIDESTDAGPIGKQSAFRLYSPATSRTMGQAVNLHDPFPLAPSTVYTLSYYVKTSGKAGTAIARVALTELDAPKTSVIATTALDDAAEATWTRKTSVITTNASTRFGVIQLQTAAASGTGYISGIQLEQGSAATAYRNAPADDAPIVWELVSTRDLTGLAAGEADSRDLAGNFFLPWDATLDIRASGAWSNSGANDNNLLASVDGANTGNMTISRSGATVNPFTAFSSKGHASSLGHAAGKTRIALRVNPSAGTISLLGTSWQNTQFIVTAYRAK